MSAVLPKRRLIPKWRKSDSTLQNAEAISLAQQEPTYIPGDEEELSKAISLWKEYKQPGLLGEVLSFSFHPELLPKVLEVGHGALTDGSVLTPVQKRFIDDLTSNGEGAPNIILEDVREDHKHPFQAPIKRLRNLLRVAPHDILALLDYAQLQAALGKDISAERAIVTALQLAPNNRVVLRTYARFLVHIRQHGRAHKLISRHGLTLHDPWLMASEIALADAANIQSKLVSKGKKILRGNNDLSPAHITELAGVIAGKELEFGNLKLARELQKKALFSPNDNVIAQAIEQEGEFGLYLKGAEIERVIASSNEALMLNAWNNLDPEGVVTYAKGWHADEPFSSRPINMLSSVLAESGNYEQAIEWIKAGLLSDSKDAGLFKNLAYSQAMLGLEADAKSTLNKLRALNNKDNEPYIKATEGLILYKRGVFEAGDVLYNEAVEIFRRANKLGLAGFCRVNQTFAAIELNHPTAKVIVEQTKALLANNVSYDSAMMMEIKNHQYMENIKMEQKDKRHMETWLFDLAANTITKRESISSIGRGQVKLVEK